MVVGFYLSALIDWLAENVENAAKRSNSHRDSHWPAKIDAFKASHHSVCAAQSYTTHATAA
jgi:hypothetical protein